VAERLGVAFLDRGILTAVAQQMHLTEDAAAYDEQPPRGLFASLARLPLDDAAPMDDLEMEEHRYRAETEEFIAAATVSGAVVLGRGSQVILRGRPGVLHVFLGGPREVRIQQATEIEGIDRKTAERRQEANDRARKEYVRRSYGVEGMDPDLYHLRIDSTAIDLDTTVDLIVAAAHSRMEQSTPTGRR
jgi:cytidylate kinase